MNDAHLDKEAELLPELALSLYAAWGVLDPHAAPSDWEAVRRALEERIGELLHSAPAKLTTAMYLLDISELQFARAMDQPTHQDRAHALSLVVMERETQKMRMRRKYRKDPPRG